MSVDTRTAFERHKPSVDLRAFLDPLKPGAYFDCGTARLPGIDQALEEEALRRGRAVGDDGFQLVATDGGLIYCRASIMFAIAARWKDLTIGRLDPGDQEDEAILPVSWPTHGDLQFTVSRRLGSNIFRRWLQVQAQATRRSQVEQDVRFERNGNGRHAPVDGDEPTGNGAGEVTANGHETGHLTSNGTANGTDNGTDIGTESGTASSTVNGHGPGTVNGDGDHPAIGGGVGIEHGAVDGAANGHATSDAHTHGDAGAAEWDPLATLDAAVVDEWVDDRRPTVTPPARRVVLDEDVPTVDPFSDHVATGSVRFESRRPAGEMDHPEPDRDPSGSPVSIDEESDPGVTRLMRRTPDGTDIFPDQRRGGAAGDPRRPTAGAGDPASRTAGSGSGPLGVPVPEINGARLQRVESASDSVSGPRLDIRSTLLAGRRESEWVEILRRRQMSILGVVTILALALIALIGFLSGGDGGENTTAVDVGAQSTETTATTVAAVADGSATASSDGAGSPAPDGGVTTDATVPSLRVSSTSVQICHSNYGGCVPVAADVDCEGDGDGPAFQIAPVAVFGDDVYDLDTDDDREACEPDQPRADAADGG